MYRFLNRFCILSHQILRINEDNKKIYTKINGENPIVNFPFFRIFPQSWTGHYCGYCGKQHGKQEWRDEYTFPSEVFNSKKCLMAAIRKRKAELKKHKKRNIRTIPTHNPKRTTGGNMLSETTINKAKMISKYLQEFCSKHHGQTFKPKDVLPFLVEKNVFKKEDSRKGRDLRQVFRDVDAAGKLNELISQVYPERKPKNTYWFIRAV